MQTQKDLNSFLWLIKRSPPAYFFGTIHVPYTRVWDYIPRNSKEAFQNSQNVYFELDLNNRSTMEVLKKCQLLPNGTIKTILPEKLFKRLKSHLRYIKRQIPYWIQKDSARSAIPFAIRWFELVTKDWKKKRPIWVMLLMNSLTESDIRNRVIPVLDQRLARVAKDEFKYVGAVEEVHEQCEPLNSLNMSQVSNNTSG